MYNFRRHYINQVDEADCGVAALAMILHNYGSKISLATLRKFTKTTTDGTTALGIVKAAKKLKMDVEAALCPVKYTDQIDKNFRRLDCGIVPRSSRFCLCKRVWY
ncbi:hypothetical protein GIX79_08435 [Lactobacillus reuteri]|uniref:Peptidase C39 domain-containing protein n=2 Tax=Limosilactobacillus reuteri TaxID=1598 RepID=A0AAW9U4T6_LIMRT|nr:hypothetical protein [Limosilactobacillus reuteri]